MRLEAGWFPQPTERPCVAPTTYSPPSKRLKRHKLPSDRAEVDLREHVPSCPRCERLLPWRGGSHGGWHCDPCGVEFSHAEAAPRGSRRYVPPRALPASILRGRPIFTSLLGNNWTKSEQDSVFPGSPKPADEPGEAHRAWRDSLEILTSPLRRQRAMRHRLKAAVRRFRVEVLPIAEALSWRQERRPGPLEAVPAVERVRGVLVVPFVRLVEWVAYSQWHEQRYGGQARKFSEKIARCGHVERVIETFDPETGEQMADRELVEHCDNWRACFTCAKRRQRRLQRDLTLTMREAERARSWERSRRYHGPEGRWMWKLVTLTMRHTGDPSRDVSVLLDSVHAWNRALSAHLRKDRGCRADPVWVRALEVTESDGGHAHLHVLWLGPYLDDILLRTYWGRVLEARGIECDQKPWEEAMRPKDEHGQVRNLRDQRVRTWCRTMRGRNGRQPAALPWPHFHVTALRGDNADAAAAYAAKIGVATYVTKGSEVQRMDPLHAAAIYQALEGRRAIQWARGWAPKRKSPLYHRLRRMSDAEMAAWQARQTGGQHADRARVSSVTLDGKQGDSCSASNANYPFQTPITGPPAAESAATAGDRTPKSGSQLTLPTFSWASWSARRGRFQTP